MKGKQILPQKSKLSDSVSAKTTQVPGSSEKYLADRVEHWLSNHRKEVIIVLVLCWVLIRLVVFNTIANGPLYNMYQWPDSDNFFYDEWARKLADGDWLNRQSIHPYHPWHREFADYYFKQHPEKLQEILTTHPNADSSFVPGKVLWSKWYGGNSYHQEPLYAYVLAALYALTGNGVYWMMLLQGLLGIGTGVLLWLIARKHFGDTVALVTGILYLFCGIVLFQEALILRTTWMVFFAVASIRFFDQAVEKRTRFAFFGSGLCFGLAFLVQSTFLLFMLGAIAIYGWKERKRTGLALQNLGMLLLGFFLVFSPLIVRNCIVGAPLFSISSVGAITFAASNVHGTKTIETWMPDASKCAEIMGDAGGQFTAVALKSIKTHPSLGSYSSLIWSKFRQVIHGVEWPNNENYYFYKQLVPAITLAFIDFYWIVWLGAAGILFSIYERKKCRVLFLAIIVQLLLLLGFYVLGRFRCPLATLLLPLAAYGLVECLKFSRGALKRSMAKIGVAALCFLCLSYSFYLPGFTGLDVTDYNILYELNYYTPVKTYAESGQYDKAIAAHQVFLASQPEIVKNASRNQVRYNQMDIKILYLFAEHYQIHSYLYEDSGNKTAAAAIMAQSVKLKLTADYLKQRLKK